MTTIETTPGRVLIHFGSSLGEQFGIKDEAVVDDFVKRNPEFKIPGRDD